MVRGWETGVLVLVLGCSAGWQWGILRRIHGLMKIL